MCVKPQALLGALASKLEREGVEPTAKEIASLVAAGCTEQEVRAALERARQRRLTSLSSGPGASGTREGS